MSNNLSTMYHADPGSEELTVRHSTPADASELRRLAELDSAPMPVGPCLIAELDGVAVAAYGLGEMRAIADPFSPTAAIVDLLAARAMTLRPAEEEPQSSLWRTTGLRAAPASSNRRTGVV